MKRSHTIFSSIIFILFLIIALLNNKVQATSVEPPIYFGIAELRTTTQMGYAMGNPVTGAERIWKIVQYSNTNYDDPTEVSAYCIKADQGFSNDTLTDIYDVSYNMKTEREAISKQNNILAELISGGQYDNLLALADILYVKGVSTETEREKLLDISGANDVIEKSDFNGIEEYYITDDEIDVVQQAAIWYFTNYKEGGEYDHYNEDSWIWYTSVDDKGVYNNLSSYDPKNMSYPSATAGYYREQQMVKLYRYLIDTAKSNAQKGINDEKTILTVYASNENPEAQPIMEVVKLPREFDLSLRKYITEVNDEEITNSRVPVIDESTLETGTTAIYKHRKDPVEVKLNDTITYNITIYNEGEKAGRATEIVDQLPTGLEFVEVVSGNFQTNEYNEQTNTVYLTRKANNTTNLPAYEEGNLSSETIQIKCKVTTTGGQSDKILTNIAWIAEEIDEDGTVITNEPGDDRDSEPSTITTQTKDELVTTNNGYIGNSNNNGKDLTNSESYFEGQQDDDDFEKLVVRAVTSIDVSKVWNDSENQDGLRTDNVTVELLIDGKPTGKTITLKADEWTGSFENLPTKIDGKDVTYSVKETTSISGYTTNTNSTDSTGKSFTITNTHKIFDLSLRKYITKVGDTDINNRTPSINTNSLSTGTTATYNHRKDPVVVEPGDMVIYNLTIYNEGEKAGRATKIEDQLPTGLKYVEVVSGNFELDSYSETDNLLKLKRTSNTDNLSAYDGGATLSSETIQIKCEVTANAGSEDSILTNVAWISEAYDAEDNKTITTEEKADTDSEPGTKPNVNKDDLVTTDDGYVGNSNNSGKDLTNSQEYFEGEQDDDDFEKIVVEARTQITVTKQWNDNDDQDGKRPENVQVELYKNGTTTGQTKTLTGTAWTATFTNLPVYENGEKITYTVKEVNVPDGYTVSGDGTEANDYTITNTHTPDVTEITAKKQWNDNNDQDGVRPESVEFELYKNNTATGNKKTLTGDSWTVIFDNLPVHEDGEKITYTVKEVNVPDGYTVNGDGTEANDYTITNTHTPDVTEITAKKQWNDNNDQDGIRPESVEFELYKNNTATGNKKTLTGNNWTVIFDNLPVYEEGEEITYTVKEVNVPDGYTASGDGTEENDYTIINTHIPGLTSVSVNKIWNDNNDQDGVRPDEIQVELLKNGQETGNTVTLNAGNNWTDTFDNLPTYENGEKITYTVKEVTVDGYNVQITTNGENNFTITNTHTPDVTEITAKKQWNDNNDQDGVRPESVEFELYKNNEATGNKKTLTGDNWTVIFDNLPVYEEGEEITYTVKEVNVPDGYTASGDGTEENDYTIINTHIPGLTSVSVNKIWNDNNDQDGVRPDEIQVELLKNGQETGNTVTLNAGNNWTDTFDNLPAYEDGEKITYTVKEVTVDGYNVEITPNGENSFTITNTHTPGVTSINVNKVWNDNNDQDGVRPDEIQVELLKNGQETGNTITLNERNSWKGTFNNLPVNENGEKITYTVKEITVSGYAVNITQNSENNFTITNTHTPGVTSVNVNKVWDDKDNQDGLRPDSIEVELLKNGEPTGNIITLNEKNYWTGTFNNLPVKEDGKEIIYTVRENTQIEGYTTEITENTETANNANDTRNVANVEEPEITTQTYAAKDMVRATVATVEPKSFRITNTHIVEDAFDLALRKFIVAVSEDETIEESDILMNEDGTGYAREPVVDASKLNTTDENGNTITTAIYNHTKEPVLVEKNDIVVYMLRVYNEGEQDGYAAEIKDYLPSYLTFVDGEFNQKYGWEVSADGRTVTTRYLENSVIAKPQTDASGNNTLSYVQVPIMCRVSDSANANENITNIADITEYQDANKEPVEDRDSKQDNVETPSDENLPGYKDDEIDQDYVPGQEDDDDFEKVYVQDFDLALRKFISEVDGVQYDREPNVNLSGLQNGTTAIYNHTKDPVLVKRNSVIIYTIRVYNEGNVDGYAERITDYLPKELEFLPEHEVNIQYEWEVSEDGRYVTTDYLSSAKETTDRQNEMQAFDGQTLDYKEVQIACRVKADTKTNVQLTNLAEITEDSDEDRDSTPDNVEIPSDEELPNYKDDEINQDYVPGQEDDDDFEKVIVQEFDLALRKFITKVDEEDVTTRVPEVSYDREEDQITYNHTKDPVEVITGNVVEYTIRVYNEGDIAGYAQEVADDIPDGLRYLPENETNIEYRWVMYDEEGNVTENSEEAVEIRTDYLSKEQEETEGENLLEAFNPEEEIGEGNPDYRDIKVAFEVVEPNESDRIIVNSAQITEDSDESGNPVEDVDSIPDEWNEGEDDQDREYIKLTYFDLALRKWVTEAIVIENGQETITQTGHTAEMDPEPVVKVELYRKNINDVVVKFRYKIRITNEGDIAGYATEITDYVPEGLRFVAEDNPGWTDEGNNVISTRLLENTLLQPGESAEVEVVLTWINGEDNMGQMTNIAEISEDYNDKGAPDRDSTPDNQVWGEDDIDDAPVLLSIETGQERIYYVLGFTVLGTLAGGLVLIKKFVI